MALEIVLGTPDGTPRWVKWKLILVCFKIELISTQDRCMVCVKRAIGFELVLGTPGGTPTWCGSSGSSFQFVWR
jgi:hypothetical protein